MWYWDIQGEWNINASGRDLGFGGRVYNWTQNLSYALTKAVVISPWALSWPGVNPGQTDIVSNTDPTIINNTGNYNNSIDVKAYNLTGEAFIPPGENISASSFSVGLSGIGGAECNAPTTATLLSTWGSSGGEPYAWATIVGSNSNPGSLSAGGGQGQELFYYCLRSVPPVSTQIYSAKGTRAWTIIYNQ